MGKNRTRLDMTFTEISIDKARLEPKKDSIAEALDHWDRYADNLEKDYKKSLRN